MGREPIGIGIIGTGFGAKVQLPGFLNIPGARVVGIASNDLARSEALAAQHLLPRSFGSYEELIACDDVHLVSIATPPFAHEALVAAAIAAGKHVLCEKPFTMNAAQARGLLEKAEAAGVLHAVDYEFRTLPAMEALREHIKDLGALKGATLEWAVGTWANPNNAWRWQCDRSQGGGVLGALGVHLFDAAEWLFGPMVTLTADLRTRIPVRPDGAGGTKAVTSEDDAVLAMKNGDGLPVTVAVTNVDPDGKGLSIMIEGERGTLALESASQRYGDGLKVTKRMHDEAVLLLLEETTAPEGYDPRISPFRTLAAGLVDGINKGARGFRPSFEEGLRGQLIREAALASNGATIDIPGR